jgi:hypothetical protein
MARTEHKSCTVRCVTEHGDNLVGIVTVVHEFYITTEILQLGLLDRL